MKPFFQDANFTIYLGDALKILPKLRDIADMIFADPPYNLSKGGFTCRGGKRACVDKGNWDKIGDESDNFKFARKWIRACGKSLKKSGTIWISGTYHSIYDSGFALRREGFKVINDIAWFKPNAPPNLSCRCFTASHETLIWAKKNDGTPHIFNYQVMKNLSVPNDPYKKDGKQMRTVWSIPSAKKSEKLFGSHSAQKPLALMDRIILASTVAGGMILDPFCGSATAGISAVMLKRKFIGIEKEPEFAELSVKRYLSIFKIWE